MGALLRLVMLGLLAWAAFRLLQRALNLPPAQSQPEPPPSGPMMRRCAYCQVHIPETESTQSRGYFFCCEAHRDAFVRERL